MTNREEKKKFHIFGNDNLDNGDARQLDMVKN